MPIALALCWIELKILSWLIVEEVEALKFRQASTSRRTPTRPAIKKSPKPRGPADRRHRTPEAACRP